MASVLNCICIFSNFGFVLTCMLDNDWRHYSKNPFM